MEAVRMARSTHTTRPRPNHKQVKTKQSQTLNSHAATVERHSAKTPRDGCEAAPPPPAVPAILHRATANWHQTLCRGLIPTKTKAAGTPRAVPALSKTQYTSQSKPEASPQPPCHYSRSHCSPKCHSSPSQYSLEGCKARTCP